MIFDILFMGLILSAVVIFVVGVLSGDDNIWSIGLFVLCVVILVDCLFLCYQCGEAISDINKVEMITENIVVYENQRESISAEIKYELGKYPQFEKEIFKSISPEAMSLYFVKYPELKSSETVMALSKELICLQKTIFQQQIDKNKVVKDIKYRNQNKITYSLFMPRYKVEY